ncbi:13154_t:CDS:2 [Acaulospora colombiana]|uniref:13154_t:CDS:1 n=1 Tax=Acaulospora colombiana TaxID=27376 RepID=A0ACA9MR89_9GLOM|nr:13154_t:CDS:2 [Acaulospora colombiana]
MSRLKSARRSRQTSIPSADITPEKNNSRSNSSTPTKSPKVKRTYKSQPKKTNYFQNVNPSNFTEGMANKSDEELSEKDKVIKAKEEDNVIGPKLPNKSRRNFLMVDEDYEQGEYKDNNSAEEDGLLVESSNKNAQTLKASKGARGRDSDNSRDEEDEKKSSSEAGGVISTKKSSDDEENSENNSENEVFRDASGNSDKDTNEGEDGEFTEEEEIMEDDSEKETDGSEDNSDHDMEVDVVSSNETKKMTHAQGGSKDFSGDKKEEKDSEPIPLLSRPGAAKQFRDYYMSQMTKAFGDDLDVIRKESNLDENKIEILKDTLESGIVIFSEVEKELTLASQKLQ